MCALKKQNMHKDNDAQASKGDSAGKNKKGGENAVTDDSSISKAEAQKLKRRQRDAERHRKSYSTETEEQRKKRRERDALRHRMVYQQKLQKKRMAELKVLSGLASGSQDGGDDSDVSDETDFSSGGLHGLKINTSHSTSPLPDEAAQLSEVASLSRRGSKSTPKAAGRGRAGTRSTRSSVTSASSLSTHSYHDAVFALDAAAVAAPTEETQDDHGAPLDANAFFTSDSFDMGRMRVSSDVMPDIDPTADFDFTVVPDELTPLFPPIAAATLPAAADPDDASALYLPEGSLPSDLDALDAFFTFNPSISISFEGMEHHEDASRATTAVPGIPNFASAGAGANGGIAAAAAVAGAVVPRPRVAPGSAEKRKLDTALGIASVPSESSLASRLTISTAFAAAAHPVGAEATDGYVEHCEPAVASASALAYEAFDAGSPRFLQYSYSRSTSTLTSVSAQPSPMGGASLYGGTLPLPQSGRSLGSSSRSGFSFFGPETEIPDGSESVHGPAATEGASSDASQPPHSSQRQT